MTLVSFYRISFFCDQIVYRQTSYIRGAPVGNKIVDHSDVVVGAAPTTSPFST